MYVSFKKHYQSPFCRPAFLDCGSQRNHNLVPSIETENCLRLLYQLFTEDLDYEKVSYLHGFGSHVVQYCRMQHMTPQAQRALSGGAIGAAGGLAVGALAGGSLLGGALIGSAAGATIGALTH